MPRYAPRVLDENTLRQLGFHVIAHGTGCDDVALLVSKVVVHTINPTEGCNSIAAIIAWLLGECTEELIIESTHVAAALCLGL